MTTVHGVVPIIATPFDSAGELDLDDLRTEVRWLVDAGVDGLGIAIASEVFALSESEWEAVVEVTCEAASDTPVVASVGQESGEASARRAEAAAKLGASILMAYPPRGRELTDDELYDFYATIAAAGTPLWVQDAPQLTGVEVSLAMYERLAAIPAVSGFKVEAHPTPAKVAEARRLLGPEITLLGGAGGFTFPDELAAGSDGTMPGAAHAEAFIRTWRCFRDDGIDAARTEHETQRAVWDLAAEHAAAFVPMQKSLLVAGGVFRSDYSRFTMAELDPAVAEQWLEVTQAASRAGDLMHRRAG